MNDQTADIQPALVRLVADLLTQLDGTIVTECEFRAGDHHVLLKRSLAPVTIVSGASSLDEEVIPASWLPILSPLTGIFYVTESPQSPPFVTVGATISLRQVVGLIESMKMYNPVETEVEGTVRAILVQASSVVEKGQVLMYVEPVGDSG
jgi:acetyl-CoA carboxylase biotin carboxyl carrier protein